MLFTLDWIYARLCCLFCFPIAWFIRMLAEFRWRCPWTRSTRLWFFLLWLYGRRCILLAIAEKHWTLVVQLLRMSRTGWAILDRSNGYSSIGIGSNSWISRSPPFLGMMWCLIIRLNKSSIHWLYWANSSKSILPSSSSSSAFPSYVICTPTTLKLSQFHYIHLDQTSNGLETGAGQS